jgi:hypothetical protein
VLFRKQVECIFDDDEFVVCSNFQHLVVKVFCSLLSLFSSPGSWQRSTSRQACNRCSTPKCELPSYRRYVLHRLLQIESCLVVVWLAAIQSRHSSCLFRRRLVPLIVLLLGPTRNQEVTARFVQSIPPFYGACRVLLVLQELECALHVASKERDLSFSWMLRLFKRAKAPQP